MTHQIFGDTETIFGYENLKIDFIFSAKSLLQYFTIHYDEKLSAEKHGIIGQNIQEKLIENECILETLASSDLANPDLLGPNRISKFSDFYQNFQQADEDFDLSTIGDLVHTFERQPKNLTKNSENLKNSDKKFQIYKGNISKHTNLRSYHKRLQVFLLWFVDAASYIEDDDNQWDFYFLFEEYTCPETGKISHNIAGYATVYNFYAYPENTRPRISQVLILPVYQRMGLCHELLSEVYKHCRTPKVVDMTVEDPSENFQRVRDYLDATLLTQLPEFSLSSLMILPKTTKDMVLAARENFKINRVQTVRIVDILLLYISNLHPKHLS